MYRLTFAIVAATSLWSLAALPAAADSSKPIVEIKELKSTRAVFKKAQRGKPVKLTSADDAKPLFDDKSLAKLAKQVDFKKQVVLVFAWRGSGQDKLTYSVLESFPEQVVFQLKPGRTRDLRPHVHVYVLRSNVKWRMAKR